jgi:predicted transcriptional regulator
MMRISYNKLWKMLIDKGMKKSDLREKSGISSASLAKLGKGGKHYHRCSASYLRGYGLPHRRYS